MSNSPRKLSPERPGTAALAVAHALALLHARQDHAAELARRAELEATTNDPRSHFSSDRQNDRSVDDQIASCRELCAREGFAVVQVFSDREMSGAFTVNRPGFQALMRAAELKAFDVIVAEDMDRLSRSQADYHNARRRLDFLGIGLHTITGQVGEMDGALRALMGEHFLKNLAVHTRRGLEAVVRSGRNAGGRAYGYRPVPGKPGQLTIDDAEAEIVRRIFREFIEGATPRAIAVGLNADRIAAPRGTRWTATTINGNLARGHGLLMNELYTGVIVWHRVRMVKDPTTGKRISRPNKAADYRRAQAAGRTEAAAPSRLQMVTARQCQQAIYIHQSERGYPQPGQA